MLLMLPSLGRALEESEAVADSVPVPSRKGAGKLRNHLRNGASRTRYLEASDTEPAGTCSSMNTVTLIPLYSQPGYFGNTWYDRKNNYSLNLQVCFILYGLGKNILIVFSFIGYLNP